MLRFVHALLGFLNILNWVMGVLFLFLFAFIAMEPATLSEQLNTEFTAGETGALMTWLSICCAVTLVVVPLAHIIFVRLRWMIRDAEIGEVFSSQSVASLRIIAFALLGISAADLVFGLASVSVSERTGEYLGWSPSLSIWLVSGLLFVLARIFADGIAMREDLEGTV